MSESRNLIEDSAAKLLARFAEPEIHRRMEEGEALTSVWAEIAESGLGAIFAASDDPWRDACVVLKACGRNVVPAPLAETVTAGAVLASAGLETPEGLIGFADGDVLTISGGRVAGTLRRVAWGSQVRQIAVVAEGHAVLLNTADATIEHDRGINREPRDTLAFGSAVPVQMGSTRLDAKALGALMRAAEMAGCIEAVLAMTVQYARERSQFGKPIGSFQAVQHQLAILAGQSAAASRIVDAAFDRIAVSEAAPQTMAFEAAVAKARTGEAAGLAASIAHQAHGAIGFTDEHRLHYFTRRLWTWRAEFGSEAFWQARLGRIAARAGADGFWPMVTAAG